MTDDLEAATDRVFAAMDEFRTGEAVHATRQVAKALARAALEGDEAEGWKWFNAFQEVWTKCLLLGEMPEVPAENEHDVVASTMLWIDALVAERDEARAALRYWDQAFATGRSEPLFIARDNGRRALDGAD
jgi:cysteinyl-tRNA synthetase